MMKFLLSPTGNYYTRSATPPRYLTSKHTIYLGMREGKTNHNTAVEKGRNGNATVYDQRASILSGTGTKMANEVIKKC